VKLWLLSICVCLLACCGLSISGEGVDLQTARCDFECRWAASPITLDGKADEPAWAAAQTFDHFYLPWLGEKSRPAKTATRARLLWDREYLYFFAEMDDTDLYADVKQHNGHTWNNDVFELFFKPAEDKPGYYEFQVNAAGTTMDCFLPQRGAGGFDRFKSDGDFHIEAKVALKGTLNKWQDKDEGWSVEGRIPWKDFIRAGGRPTENEIWRFALCRYDYSVDFEGPELSTCAPLTAASFHRYEDYARVKFVPPTKTGAGKMPDLQRYVTTSRVVGSPEPPPPYRAKRVLPNLKISWPIFVVVEPGTSRLWFIDETRPYQPARVARTADDPSTGEFETLIKYDAVAYSIAFHPQYAKNGYVYIGANGAFNSGERRTSIIRYIVERKPPFRFQPESAKTIIEWPSDGHNGGAIAFGNDGMLYVTSGDGTGDSDGDTVGQDLAQLRSKVLRIDVDHPDDGKAYSIPKDNPFLHVPSARPETWAYGLRNPWRITVDPRTGHVWVGNNGQDLFEQVYLIERGANYGWSVYEGSQLFYPNRQLGPTPVSKPTLEHPHSESRSLTGGVVYYGKNFPELQGAYIYGDYSTGKIWGAKHDGQKLLWHKELADTNLQITAFALDADGELLVVDHQGKEQGGFHTLEANPDDSSHVNFPKRLSDSGLFRSVARREVQPGVIPYSVNSPLWSDGAYKERFMALPPTMIDDGQEMPAKISFSSGSWSFPDKTVLIKSFALDLKEGDPSSRRWIETRFLTRQQGEWVGYSYQWNNKQTDAVLVDKAGFDQEFTIATAKGTRQQKWHYPSRTECMVCHSRAAGFVLGTTTPQMNRNHDYGGDLVENQIHLYERMGLFHIGWHLEAIEALRKELTAQGLKSKDVEQQLSEAIATRDQRKAPPTSLLFQSPEKYDCLANPYDESLSLDRRARSYLQVNCAQCHVLAGGGNAQFDVAITTPVDQMKLVDVKPQHHAFGITDARLIAPGQPERSVLLHRISHRDQGHMPPLATSMVDRKAVNLIRQWITDVPAAEDGQ
jgi:uncharacterized repeat protein (TIGR03806 family)